MLLGALQTTALVATLLVLAPVARANDRDLRGTPVPASACSEVSRFGLTQDPWFLGYYFVVGANGQLSLRCPLSVNDVELSGASNDNDISKIRVHYGDGDGAGTGAFVYLQFIKSTVSGSGTAENTVVCTWHSNLDGNGTTTVRRSTKSCVHDLAAGAFYHFRVIVDSGPGAAAQFLGIDFPS